VVIAAAAATAGQPAPKDAVETAFKVKCLVKMAMKIGGKEANAENETTTEYRWRREAKARTLLVDSVEVRGTQRGKVVAHARMSRGEFADLKGGRTVKAEDAPELLRKALTETFGTPLCKVELDDAGKEQKRTVTAGPGTAPLNAAGMVSHPSIFHPWYAPDRDEWEAPMEATTGQGGSVTGKATYTKIPGGKGGQAVKVSGTLTAEGTKAAGGLVFKEVKYVVKGEQTFDPKRGEWVAGRLAIDVSFTATDGKEVTITAGGEILLTLEALADKK
jgi:hypothetical protein